MVHDRCRVYELQGHDFENLTVDILAVPYGNIWDIKLRERRNLRCAIRA